MNSKFQNSELVGGLPYNIERRDRTTRGGGVAIIYRDHFITKSVQINPKSEILALDLVLDNSEIFRLCCFYRPPSYNRDQNKTFFEQMHLTSAGSCNFVACGDMNIDYLKIGDNHYATTMARDFLKTANLNQMVSKPTNKLKSKIIDWLIISNERKISEVDIVPPFLSTDHCSISFLISGTPHSIIGSAYPQYHKANFDAMNSYFNNVDWDMELSGHRNITCMYARFCNIVINAINEHVPKKYKGEVTKEQYPEYIRNMISHRNKLFYKSHVPAIRKEFEKVNLQISNKILKWEKNKQKRFLFNKNGKLLYNYLQKVTKPLKGGFRHGIYSDGKLIFENSVRAELLGQHFAKIHASDKPFTSYFPYSNTSELLSNVTFLPFQVEKISKVLKASTSLTNDEIPQIIFQRCAKSLAVPLAHIFNFSMIDSSVPSQWKTANIVPILKTGKNHNDVNSYRPISLLCTPLKIMERLIKEKLNAFLERNNVIPDEQFGFRNKTSVIDQLLDTVTDYTEAVDQKKNIDVVYFDFSKAFDKVPINLLLFKCKKVGVAGNLINWLEEYLRNRTFYVSVNGDKSSKFNISSGVPQGSVLGPILFSIYISDLPKSISKKLNVHIKMFADDVKIYKIIVDKDTDCPDLQKAIDEFCEWAEQWGLHLAKDKCSVLHIGNKNPKYCYQVGTTILPTTDETKDLGLYFDTKLSNKTTIKERTTKSLRALHAILRAIKVSNPNILTKCFKTYVLPILEFGSPIWSPFQKKEIKKIESVQKLFTKIVFNRCSIPLSSYPERCKALSLQTLQTRRMFNDLCVTYKILNGFTRLPSSKFFQYRVGFGRNSKPSLYPRRSRTELHRHSFTIRCSKWYGKLPPKIRTSPTLKTFKQRLKCIDLESLLL